MKLLSLTTSGFKHLRGSRGPLKFSFAGGVIGVRGANESGKTSLMEAVFFCLFGTPLDTQSKLEELVAYGRNKALLQLDFQVEGQMYSVSRSVSEAARGFRTSASLHRTSDGTRELIASKPTGVNDEISRLLGGMGPEEARSTIFVMQKDLPRIKEKSSKDRRELIDRIMMRESLDKAREELNERKKDLEGTTKRSGLVEQARLRLQELERDLKEYSRMKQEVGKLEGSIRVLSGPREAGGSVAESEAKLERVDHELSALESYAEYVNVKDRLESKLTSTRGQIKAYGGRKKDLAARATEIGEEIQEKEGLKETAEQAKRAEEELKSIEERIERLESRAKPIQRAGMGIMLIGVVLLLLRLPSLSVVATLAIGTAAALYGTQEHARAGQMRKESSDLFSKKEELLMKSKEYAKLPELEAKLAGQKQIIEGIDGDILGLESQDQELRSQLEGLKEPQLPPEIEAFSKQVLEERREEQKVLSRELGSRQQSLRSSTDRLGEVTQILEERKDIEEMVTDQRSKLEEFEGELRKVLTAMELLEGAAEASRKTVVPAVRAGMSSILPVITANRYGAVDVRENYEIFVYDAKAGEYKELRTFSGGAQDQILLAMRLAFTLSLVPRVRGVHPDFLFLDEVLASSDEERRDSIMELIASNLRKSFEQVIVISHQEDVLRYAEQRVELLDGMVVRDTRAIGARPSQPVSEHGIVQEPP